MTTLRSPSPASPAATKSSIIGFVALLIFGNRLPTLMRSLGQGVVEFKKGINGVEDDPKTPA